MNFTDSLNKLRDKFFSNIHKNNLVYNTCWEDPRVDRKLLKFDTTSEIVMITSAGCNALEYLLDKPEAINCIDVNDRQNALLELKKSFFKKMEHKDLFQFFGRGRVVKASTQYESYLRSTLKPEHQLFWDEKIDYFKEKKRKKSFYFRGTSGRFAWLFSKYLQTQPGTRELLQNLLDANSLDEQKELYAKLEPKIINNWVKWIMNRHATLSLLGVPRAQKDLIANEYPGGMIEYLADSLRHVFTQIPIKDNYFWYVYITGNYETDICPEYLKKEHFDFYKDHIETIKTHNQTVANFLEENPGKYSHFVLLDHQDWMAEHDEAALEHEWKLVLQNSKPGTKILLRSAHLKPDFIPQFVLDKTTSEEELVKEHALFDRVGTYASTLLLTVK
jgi:S-adenosylmethionine-diacylglycerol 3-amino-3-carboxypropyl transferase